MALVVEILNKSLNKVAEVKNLYPIDQAGNILRYSKELSDYGQCLFRMRTRDPLFDAVGDITVPHTYNIRIRDGSATLWQGAIVDNSHRTRDYIEVKGLQYLYYLDKMLVRRTSNNPATSAADGIFRIFNSGTMSTAVTNIVTDAKSDFGANHPLANLTLGTIENPNYPVGFTDGTTSLTGAWNFSSTVSLQYDFHSVYYILKAFGIYTYADFQITDGLVFNFEKFLGTKQSNMVFQYGTRGNVVDYDAPRLGRRMVNDLWGIATDSTGKIYHLEQTDSTSINQYGKLEAPNAYADVKDNNFLKARIAQDLRLTSTPDTSPLSVVVDDKAFPQGQYDTGDIATFKIKDHNIDLNVRRRIVGYTVNVHNTGRKLTTIQTNIPRPEDLGQ